METTPERRSDGGVAYEPVAGRLSLGTGTATLPVRTDNRRVLETYIDLVAAERGERPAAVGHLREADLEALTFSLDLDAPDLLTMIEDVLHTTPKEAIGILARLQANRILAGVAAAGLVAALTGGLVVGVAQSSEDTTPSRPAPAVADRADTPTSTPAPDVTETPDGVGLIPPVEIEREAGGLVPPAVIERTPEEAGVLVPPAVVERTPEEAGADTSVPADDEAAEGPGEQPAG
ncbi:MAG TPA: hypothetical protein VHK88_07035 [Aquihabitans sp.]|nr:hypothetical protein [Aquihabitans sp.]